MSQPYAVKGKKEVSQHERFEGFPGPTNRENNDEMKKAPAELLQRDPTQKEGAASKKEEER